MNFVLQWNSIERRMMLVELGAEPSKIEWGDQFPHEGKRAFWSPSWRDARETFPMDVNDFGR